MKKIIVLITILFLSFACKSNAFEWGLYGGVGSNFQTSAAALGIVGLKIRDLNYCPIGFNLMLNVPYGVDAEFNLYLVHHRNFKFYIITGVELYWLNERPSVDWLRGERGSADLVVGSGIEIQWGITLSHFKSVSLSAEWRMFAPNPIWVVESFADFGRLIYRETAKEGQLWIGVTFWL